MAPEISESIFTQHALGFYVYAFARDYLIMLCQNDAKVSFSYLSAGGDGS